MTPVPPQQSAERQLDASAPETIGLVRSPLGLGWRLWNKHEDFYEDADATVKYVRASDLTRLNAKVVELERERDEARSLVTEANNSLFGSQGKG